MKVSTEELGGEVIRDTKVYKVEDNSYLEHLNVSKTTLNPGEVTKGHKHEGKEEVYHFLSGNGVIKLDGVAHIVKAGDLILIKGGVHHKVTNILGGEPLIFVCIFEKYGDRT